jgi:hypothetical protein
MSRSIILREGIDLTGLQVVPPVQTTNAGIINNMSVYEEKRGTGSMRWRISTSLRVEDVDAAHIHRGSPGQNGDVYYTLPRSLYPRSGAFAVSEILPWTSFQPIDSVFDLVQVGQAYMDIHTMQYPKGNYAPNSRRAWSSLGETITVAESGLAQSLDAAGRGKDPSRIAACQANVAITIADCWRSSTFTYSGKSPLPWRLRAS